jgi:hypothetical protein
VLHKQKKDLAAHRLGPFFHGCLLKRFEDQIVALSKRSHILDVFVTSREVGNGWIAILSSQTRRVRTPTSQDDSTTACAILAPPTARLRRPASLLGALLQLDLHPLSAANQPYWPGSTSPTQQLGQDSPVSRTVFCHRLLSRLLLF